MLDQSSRVRSLSESKRRALCFSGVSILRIFSRSSPMLGLRRRGLGERHIGGEAHSGHALDDLNDLVECFYVVLLRIFVLFELRVADELRHTLFYLRREHEACTCG